MAGAFQCLAQKGARQFGIHALLASNAGSNEYYPELAAQLFRLAVRLHRATGLHIAFVNLSGGVGVDYRPEQPACDIEACRYGGCGHLHGAGPVYAGPSRPPDCDGAASEAYL